MKSCDQSVILREHPLPGLPVLWTRLLAKIVVSEARVFWVCLCAQLCLTHRDPVGCSLPSSSVHGILQARMLEWVAISFSKLPSEGVSFPLPGTCHWILNSISALS